jgi:hypothetical protein
MKKFLVLMVLLTTTVVAAFPLGAAALSLGSLRGSYGFRMTKFGTCPNVSADIGILAFDGHGNVSGIATSYQSNPNGAGVAVVNATLQGTYQVNADGTGSLEMDVIVSGSAIDAIHIALVIDNRRAQLELIDIGLNSTSCAAAGVATKQ